MVKGVEYSSRSGVSEFGVTLLAFLALLLLTICVLYPHMQPQARTVDGFQHFLIASQQMHLDHLLSLYQVSELQHKGGFI